MYIRLNNDYKFGYLWTLTAVCHKPVQFLKSELNCPHKRHTWSMASVCVCVCYVNDSLYVIRMQIEAVIWFRSMVRAPCPSRRRVLQAYVCCSLLLLVFGLSKRSCNEKTGISVSRTGKQPPSPSPSAMESVIRNTSSYSEELSVRTRTLLALSANYCTTGWFGIRFPAVAKYFFCYSVGKRDFLRLG
jgi:hypothetical protein